VMELGESYKNNLVQVGWAQPEFQPHTPEIWCGIHCTEMWSPTVCILGVFHICKIETVCFIVKHSVN
jgi:hypothetical protein